MLGLDLLHQILAGDLHLGGLHISKVLKCNKALLILKKVLVFKRLLISGFAVQP